MKKRNGSSWIQAKHSTHKLTAPWSGYVQSYLLHGRRVLGVVAHAGYLVVSDRPQEVYFDEPRAVAGAPFKELVKGSLDGNGQRYG